MLPLIGPSARKNFSFSSSNFGQKSFFRKWSEMERKLVGSFFFDTMTSPPMLHCLEAGQKIFSEWSEIAKKIGKISFLSP